MFFSPGLFVGFSWSSADSSKIEQASAVLASAREKGGKTAVAWKDMLRLPGGFYLPWKRPVTFGAGYMWLCRTLGDLVQEPGQTSNWEVKGHREGFDQGAAVSLPNADQAASVTVASASRGPSWTTCARCTSP